jgi:hypothetical protein
MASDDTDYLPVTGQGESGDEPDNRDSVSGNAFGPFRT